MEFFERPNNRGNPSYQQLAQTVILVLSDKYYLW